MNKPFKFFTFILIVMLVGGCTWIRSLTEDDPVDAVLPEDEKSTAELIDLLAGTNSQYDRISAGTSVRVSTPDTRTRASVRLVLVRDSLIWGTVSPAFGIELARFAVTPDSIRIINRYDRTYTSMPFSMIHNYTGSNALSFSDLQSLLIGNYPFGNDVELESRTGSKYHELYNNSTDENLVLRVNPGIFKTAEYEVERPERGQFLKVEYNDYQEIDERFMPGEVNIQARLPREYDIAVIFQNVNFEAEQNLRFDVPDNYKRVR